jgi:hypothetical protein
MRKRVRKSEREREREKERERETERQRCRIVILILKGMTGALAPFSDLVDYIYTLKRRIKI